MTFCKLVIKCMLASLYVYVDSSVNVMIWQVYATKVSFNKNN